MTDKQLRTLRAHQKFFAEQLRDLRAAEKRGDANTPSSVAQAVRAVAIEIQCDFPNVIPPFDDDALVYRNNGTWVQIAGLRTYVARVVLALVAELEEIEGTVQPRSGSNDDYVAASKIETLKALNRSSTWDLKRLIRLCEEINIAHRNDAFLSVAMLVRALMDHVPPLFEFESFEQVASNADRSVKDLLMALQSTKPIGDRALHVQIARRVPVPTAQQVDLKHHVDVLLEYMIGQLE